MIKNQKHADILFKNNPYNVNDNIPIAFDDEGPKITKDFQWLLFFMLGLNKNTVLLNFIITN